MEHYPGHIVMGIAALAATLAISSVAINRLVRRRLRLSVGLLVAYIAANLMLWLAPTVIPGAEPDIRAFEQLALAAALINLVVVSVLNPLRTDRIPDRYPTIVQDAIIIGLLLFTAIFFLSEKLMATSAVSAVVLGFALQDTLGNAFAGLALQSEKPFHVGHWIRVGEFEGRVAEITWRATKLRTKTGNFIILPNNVVSKEAITNYSQPSAPTRLEVEVGASYLSTPGAVRAAIDEAMANAPLVLKAPAPEILLVGFDNSAVTYRARFWIEDYARDEDARDEVRTAIYYSFARHGIEIPWPIQVEYAREWPPTDPNAPLREREEMLARVELLAALDEQQRGTVAAATATRTYGNGEAIVRQGTPGQSMFVVCAGQAVVKVGDEGRHVATIPPGGYFGEMSLLTGEPRTATVIANGETVVLEVDSQVFRDLGATNPRAVEQIAVAAVARRAELEHVRSAAQGPEVADAPATLLARMRRFLGLS